MITVLEKAFELAKDAKNEDIVMCLGNMGVGKSTLLYSLAYGPQELTETKRKNENVIEGKNE